MDLSQVTIGIKTFLRPEMLANTLTALEKNFPECPVIVADDSNNMFQWPAREKMLYINCPFDSGFGFKSNLIARNVTTEYLLIGSDDFDFSPASVREGIEKLYNVSKKYPGFGVLSGRVNNRPYEFMLEDNGDVIREIPIAVSNSVEWLLCDVTVNYSLVRRYVIQGLQYREKFFEPVLWDDDVRIGGGEHGSWFVDLKRAGFKTVFVPGVNINEQKLRPSSEYRKYRERAYSPERPCFVRRGIEKYILGDGTIDYDETSVNRS